jgi:type III restriction enzyme
VKGSYARVFEEEYERLRVHPSYRDVFAGYVQQFASSEVHDGYFSRDRTGRWTETDEGSQANRDNAERGYNLIMKDKERLLSFETPLAFIFSHSALREGWDNPNVFQICALRDIRTERERRQTIGRGLRICVDQAGNRVRGDVNVLTVIAEESYESFAENLQREIEADTGIRFGIVEPSQFAGLMASDEGGDLYPLGTTGSRAVWEHLKVSGYIDASGKIYDTMRMSLRDGTLKIPEAASRHADQIIALLRKLAGRIEIKNADKRLDILARKENLYGEDFGQLWDRIKHKTAYRVHFDDAHLIEKCVAGLRDASPISSARLQWRKASLEIGKSGIDPIERAGADSVALDEEDVELPDLLSELQTRTKLTRRSLARILIQSGRLSDFKRNPQQFIAIAAATIDRCRQAEIVNGIRYEKLGDDQFYPRELFEREPLFTYGDNVLDDDERKCVYERIVLQSGTERGFARDLEYTTAVRVFTKLPTWYQIGTPLGTYNPDWAMMLSADEREERYAVVETKADINSDALRGSEQKKIKCGEAHFRALRTMDRPAQYVLAKNVTDVIKQDDGIDR